MNQPTWHGLLFNATLLLGMSVLYDLILLQGRGASRLRQVISGIVLGGIGIAIILTAFPLIDGVIFDTRSVLISISGLFFGFLPTLIAVGLTAAYRLYLGGGGALTGVMVIFTSALIGWVWRYLRRRALDKMAWWELYLFGWVVHLNMLLWMYTLPGSLARPVLAEITLPVLIIYPVATLLVGEILSLNFQRQRASRERERLLAVLESSLNEIYLFHPNTLRFEYVNAAALRNLGYTLEQMRTMTPVNIKPEYNLATFRELIQPLLKGQTPVIVFETRHRRADGSTYPVEVHLQLVKVGNEQVFLAVIQDISERLRSTLRYRTLFENAYDAVFIIEGERFIECNPRAVELFGYSREELLGKTPFEVSPPEQPDGMPSDVKARELIHLAVMGEPQLFEWIHLRKDHTPFDAEVSLSALNLEGQTLLQAIVRDITLRKRMEKNEREQRLLAETLRETALSLASTLELDELLDRILENLEKVVPASACNIMLVEDGMVRVARTRGYRERGYMPTEGIAFSLNTTQNLRTIAETGRVLIIPRLEEYPHWVRVPGTEWMRSYAGAPIVVKGEVVGFLNLDGDRPNQFSEEDGERLQMFADQAAIAFANASLYRQTQRLLRRLEAINHVSNVLRPAQTLDELLNLLLTETLHLLETQDGAIWMYDNTRDELRIAIAAGWQTRLRPFALKPGESIAGSVYLRREVYLTHNLQEDPLNAPAIRRLVPENTGGIFVPVQAGTQTLGVFAITLPSGKTVQPDDVSLVAALGEMGGAAILRMRLHEEMRLHIQRLEMLHRIDTEVLKNTHLTDTLRMALELLRETLKVDSAVIRLYNPDTQLLELAASFGMATVEHAIQPGEYLAGKAASERRTMRFWRGDPNITPEWEELVRREGLETAFALPLIAHGELMGTLGVAMRNLFHPNREWEDFLDTVAGQLALAIQSNRLIEQLRRSNQELLLAYDTTIEGWSRAMDLRDRETEGHTQRVTQLTLKLAQRMGITGETLTHLRRGALLHDIGKMGIPDHILHKPGPLTDEEWQIMRQHPVYAVEMLSSIEYLKPALEIPGFHHEKWDGSGYPYGLKGEAIPMGARIFAIVDVWDALTSDRPYRKAWTREKTVEYIREQSGKHFDPKVVEAFLKMMEEEPF